MEKERKIELTAEELWLALELVTFQAKREIIDLDEAERHALGIFEMLEEKR